MNPPPENFILNALREPGTALSYFVGQQLKRLYPHLSVLEASSGPFDLLDFAGAGHCEIKAHPALYSQRITEWHGGRYKLSESDGNSWHEVAWNGHSLSVLSLSWSEGFHNREGL